MPARDRFPPAAGAISDGGPDTDHRNVGALLHEVEPGVFEVSCTSSLLLPRHLLTAAHCLEGLAPEDLAVTRSNVAVATTSGGDRRCRAQRHRQRLDLPAVRASLDDFAAIP